MSINHLPFFLLWQDLPDPGENKSFHINKYKIALAEFTFKKVVISAAAL